MSQGPDFYLDWNGDFLLTPSGSIQTAVGWDRTRQRITRRLLTPPSRQQSDGTFSPPGYVFDPAFGVGLPQAVDRPTDQGTQATMLRNINQGVQEDSDVISTSPPSVKFIPSGADTIRIVIGVTLKNGQPGVIALGAKQG